MVSPITAFECKWVLCATRTIRARGIRRPCRSRAEAGANGLNGLFGDQGGEGDVDPYKCACSEKKRWVHPGKMVYAPSDDEETPDGGSEQPALLLSMGRGKE